MDKTREQLQEIVEEVIDEMRDQIQDNIQEMMDEAGFTILSQRSAQVLVQWAINHGHTKDEAYELLALTLRATEG